MIQIRIKTISALLENCHKVSELATTSAPYCSSILLKLTQLGTIKSLLIWLLAISVCNLLMNVQTAISWSHEYWRKRDVIILLFIDADSQWTQTENPLFWIIQLYIK